MTRQHPFWNDVVPGTPIEVVSWKNGKPTWLPGVKLANGCALLDSGAVIGPIPGGEWRLMSETEEKV